MKGANTTYWGNIKEGVSSLAGGLKLTLKHFKKSLFNKSRPAVGPASPDYLEHKEGIFTLQYPSETMPVPDHGRYRLHNEIEDCIVCDKCAKVCPVNCIDIESVKSTEEIRKTSDGSSVRLYAAKFDIDMAKCCYCGLCTTVCPTECLTMTKTYDYSEYDIRNMIYEFSDMAPAEVEEKQQAYEEAVEAKKKAKIAKATETEVKPKAAAPKISVPKPAGASKPVMKPAMKPAANKPESADEVDKKASQPVVKPKVPGRPKIPGIAKSTEEPTGTEPRKSPPKPKVPGKPVVPGLKKTEPSDDSIKSKQPPKVKIPGVKKTTDAKAEELRKVAPKPKVPGKPNVPPLNKSTEETSNETPTTSEKRKVPPMMKPKILKPPKSDSDQDKGEKA